MYSNYLIDILMLLLAAVIAVPALQALRLGAVSGFLLAGLLVGPSGLGLIDNVHEIGHLAEIGVVLLLFLIGVEIKPRSLWMMRRQVFGLGSLQIVVTALIIGTLCHLVFGLSLRASTLIGPALALSSTAFVLQLISDQKLLKSNYGRTSLAILLMQDLFVVPLLALIHLLTVQEMKISEDIGYALLEWIVIIGLVVAVGRYLLHPVLHRVAVSGNSEVFTASAVLIVLGTAMVTEYVGLSMAMGAFLAGLLISDSVYRHQVIAEIQPFRGLLLGLFFMSMGMSLNLGLFIDEPLLYIGLLGGLLLIKILVIFPLVMMFGSRLKSALAVAMVLSQSGEFALVLFSLAHESALFDELLFHKLLLIVVLSMLITEPLARVAERVYRADREPDSPVEDQPSPHSTTVIIAGFGRVGHRIGEILSLLDIPFIGLDKNVDVIEEQRKLGNPVFYGDACKAEVLRAAGAGSAGMIVVTIDDPKGVEDVVSCLRTRYPDIEIYARSRDREQCRRLHDLGATHTVSENLETSIELARMTLKTIGIDASRSDVVLRKFRRDYHLQMHAEKDTSP